MLLNNNVNTEEHVISAATALFCKYGIRSVAMDDITRECGISKKTLYRYFADKNNLVTAVLKQLTAVHEEQLKEVRRASKNAVEEVVNEFKIYVSALQDTQAVFFYELEKSYPECWQFINDFNTKCNSAFVLKNLQRGIEEGYYRPELDLHATANIRVSQLKLLVTRKVDFVEARNLIKNPDQINLFYLHAVTTATGKKMLATLTESTDCKKTGKVINKSRK